MRKYFSNILKCDTSSDYMKLNIDHWLDSFKSSTKKLLLRQQSNTIIMFLRRVDILQLEHLQVSLINKTKQNVISIKPCNCYTATLLLEN